MRPQEMDAVQLAIGTLAILARQCDAEVVEDSARDRLVIFGPTGKRLELMSASDDLAGARASSPHERVGANARANVVVEAGWKPALRI